MDDLTDFEQEGFFRIDTLHAPEYVEENFGHFLDAFYRLNKLAWSLQYKLPSEKPTDNESTRRAFCLILYSRTLNFVQAAVMLATRGMRVQADTQHRCALETLFKLGALASDEQFIIDYDLAERKDHIKQGRALLSHLNRIKEKSKDDKRNIKELEKSTKRKELDFIDRLKAHRPTLFKDRSNKEAFDKFSLSTEECARRANRQNMYDIHYRRGSASVHSDARSLEDGHFSINENGIVIAFKNKPHLEHLEMFITSYCLVIFDAVRFVGQALDYDVPENELKSIEEALEKCHKDVDSDPR